MIAPDRIYMPNDLMHCGACRWYRREWGNSAADIDVGSKGECCFGGGWGHYPQPDDECERGYVQGSWFNT